MYQTIDETVRVIGLYQYGQFVPKKFEWQNRVWPIARVTMRAEARDGSIKKWLYSVVANRQVFRLEFNRESELWRLQEVWVE